MDMYHLIKQYEQYCNLKNVAFMLLSDLMIPVATYHAYRIRGDYMNTLDLCI